MPAGAKPGQRRGGRTLGTPNKKLHPTRIAAKQGVLMAQQSAISPLALLLGIVNNDPAFKKIAPRRVACAIAAAPYCHARLAAVAYVPPPDQGDQQRRSALAGLNYQQRKQIEQILLGATIEGDPLTEDDNQ